jgi:hypothetical protein
MCRYALRGQYKPHHACFRCRKAFKRRLLDDVNPGGVERPSVCPQCRSPMASMGLDFAPPRRTAARQWATLESLWSLGVTFHSCGCSGPGYRPRDPRAYVEFLKQIHGEYATQMGNWKSGRPPRGEEESLSRSQERAEALATWSARLDAVEREMRAHRARVPPRGR